MKKLTDIVQLQVITYIPVKLPVIVIAGITFLGAPNLV
jgi:hypothetical protein